MMAYAQETGKGRMLGRMMEYGVWTDYADWASNGTMKEKPPNPDIMRVSFRMQTVAACAFTRKEGDGAGNKDTISYVAACAGGRGY